MIIAQCTQRGREREIMECQNNLFTRLPEDQTAWSAGTSRAKHFYNKDQTEFPSWAPRTRYLQALTAEELLLALARGVNTGVLCLRDPISIFCLHTLTYYFVWYPFQYFPICVWVSHVVFLFLVFWEEIVSIIISTVYVCRMPHPYSLIWSP